MSDQINNTVIRSYRRASTVTDLSHFTKYSLTKILNDDEVLRTKSKIIVTLGPSSDSK